MNTVIWRQGRVKIVRHFAGCYSLVYRDVAVMPAARFGVLCRYVWAEFL